MVYSGAGGVVRGVEGGCIGHTAVATEIEFDVWIRGGACSLSTLQSTTKHRVSLSMKRELIDFRNFYNSNFHDILLTGPWGTVYKRNIEVSVIYLRKVFSFALFLIIQPVLHHSRCKGTYYSGSIVSWNCNRCSMYLEQD